MNNMEIENIIKEYLKEVKKALPEWLKEKKEHKEILIDLEDHLREKARELSNTGEITLKSTYEAIEHMGTPKAIAKEYKRRGTPYVYITKEMWPLYLRVLTVVFAVVIILNVVAMFINIIFENPSIEQIFGNLISGIQLGILISFAVISIIFVLLSMEGYFPEDFKSKKELEKEKVLMRKVQEDGYPISKKTGKPLKPFIKPLEEIIGGGIGLIAGVFFITQPIFVGLLDPLFSILIRIFGILLTIEGSLDISRGIIGNYKPSTHQIIHGVKIILKFAGIPLIIFLALNPQIFPWFYYNEGLGLWVNVGISVEFYELFRNVMIAVAVIAGLTSIEDIYRIIKIQNYK
ncbi:MAG: hypothetical protein EU542_00245 [Promethearchaeota archaeon]|nr:MAG: hypothetical protein EU542_00245 [Candidatus Lokiarchaeota archaeon]